MSHTALLGKFSMTGGEGRWPEVGTSRMILKLPSKGSMQDQEQDLLFYVMNNDLISDNMWAER